MSHFCESNSILEGKAKQVTQEKIFIYITIQHQQNLTTEVRSLSFVWICNTHIYTNYLRNVV